MKTDTKQPSANDLRWASRRVALVFAKGMRDGLTIPHEQQLVLDAVIYRIEMELADMKAVPKKPVKRTRKEKKE